MKTLTKKNIGLGAGAVALATVLGIASASALSFDGFFSFFGKGNDSSVTAEGETRANVNANANAQTNTNSNTSANTTSGTTTGNESNLNTMLDTTINADINAGVTGNANGSTVNSGTGASSTLDAHTNAVLGIDGSADNTDMNDEEASIFARISAWFKAMFDFSLSSDSETTINVSSR